MPNIINLGVENADLLLNAGQYGAGAVIRVQTATTETGIYADVTGTGSTPTVALVAGTRSYTAYDPAGTSSSWYRTRYENVGATRASDWTAVFQVGAEEGGLLCSLYDVKQRLGITYTDASEDENLLEFIREASGFLESSTGRWLAPRPSSGTRVEVFDGSGTSALFIPYGIRSISAIGYAATDQPDTAGTYTTITATTVSLLRPTTPGWPSTVIRLLSTAETSTFPGVANGVTITGAFGWASVAPRVAGACADLAVALHRGRGDAGFGGSFTVNIDGSRTFERMPDSAFRLIREWAVRPVA